jgi:hypothetical protein
MLQDQSTVTPSLLQAQNEQLMQEAEERRRRMGVLSTGLRAAEGGLMTLHARGGSIHLKDGQYIIPADVVSALGNGSSKAGARYLTHLFTELRAA